MIKGEPPAPDGASAIDVLLYVRWCAEQWAASARVIGNARARDIVRAIDHVKGDARAVAINDAANLARTIGVTRHVSDTPRRMRERIADALDRMAADVRRGGRVP